MPNERDWKKIKKEYMKSEYISVCEFMRTIDINPLSTAVSKHTKGWRIEKSNIGLKAVEKTKEKMLSDVDKELSALYITIRDIHTKAKDLLEEGAITSKSLNNIASVIEKIFKILQLSSGKPTDIVANYHLAIVKLVNDLEED